MPGPCERIISLSPSITSFNYDQMDNPLSSRQRQTRHGAFLAPPQAEEIELNNNQSHPPTAAEPTSPIIAQDRVSRNDHLDVPDSIGQL